MDERWSAAERRSPDRLGQDRLVQDRWLPDRLSPDRFLPDDRSDPADGGMTPRSSPRPGSRSSLRPEQGIERLVSAGRQLVDGVSGARPGSRKAGREPGSGPGVRPRLGDLGRWVEDKLDWILEDEDDWREPWQEPPDQRREPQRREQRPEDPRRASSRRRPLEAVSRRVAGLRAGAARPVEEQDWPDDDSFSRPRWQRPGVPPSQPSQPPPMSSSVRPLPRSSRRRQPD
jgi:hypothetical protein